MKLGRFPCCNFLALFNSPWEMLKNNNKISTGRAKKVCPHPHTLIQRVNV